MEGIERLQRRGNDHGRIPCVKGLLPFRLGSTSYVVPADILPNVEHVAPWVDDVELVLFESPDLSNLPSTSQISRLAELAREHSLTYTVHFPIDRKAGSIEPEERARFASQACRIVEVTAALEPYAFVLHLEGVTAAASVVERSRWERDVEEVCRAVARVCPRPELVCVENLGYPSEWHLPVVERHGFSLCIDTGHLWNYHREIWEDAFTSMLPRTRVVHLHGLREGVDHTSLRNGPTDCVQLVLKRLIDGYRHVVTLEVFDEVSLKESISVVEDEWQRSR